MNDKTVGSTRLERFSVLVVEDSAFMRSVVAQTLRSIGVGSVRAVPGGGEAIRLLEEGRAGAGVDVVITDLIMPEVDGFMLLRWLRGSPRSPDKFLPVLALSAAADRHVVERVRDLGANDFIAKPFSAATIAGRLLYAIARPRRFVLAQGFFGPDRRRAERPVRMDCRMTRPEEILLVNSRSKPLGIDQFRVVHFDPPNRLGMKAGLSPRDGVPGLPDQVLAAAEAEIQARQGDYATWIAQEAEGLGRRVEALGQGGKDGELLAAINRSAHEMRGQGGIFGYPLITEVARSLFEATSGPPLVSAHGLALLKAHADAIKAVLGRRISGDGGEIGRQLLASLEIAKHKYAHAESGGGA